MLEKFQLQLARTLLICPYLNKRLLGVETIIEWIQRSERKDNLSRSREQDYGEKYDNRNHQYLPKAKWLDTDTLAEWLTENHIFDIVLKGNVHLLAKGSSKSKGVESHPSIVQKAMSRHGGNRRNHRNITSLLQFLAKKQSKSKKSIDDNTACLTRDMLNILWENALSDNQMTSGSCVEGIGDASEEFSREVFQFFNEKIFTFPIERATEPWIQMFGSYAQIALANETSETRGSGWSIFSSPAKSSKKKSKIDVNIVLDKLFDIVFSPRGIRIEADAINAAHTSLLTALKSNNEMLQHYLSKMMSNIEQGTHIEACMTMMSGLLPLLGSRSSGEQKNNYDSKEKMSKKDKENFDKLFRLRNTIVRLVVDASSSSRADRLLQFLCDICIHGNMKLSSDTIKEIWEPLTKRGSEYATVLFKWMVSCF